MAVFPSLELSATTVRVRLWPSIAWAISASSGLISETPSASIAPTVITRCAAWKTSADPLVASVSALLIVLTLVVVLIVDRSAGLSRTFVR
ncbi:hypothetical protein [Bosea psychrotolerans]|nr:hypothetical protein [Bosea psychrotolerans]